MGPAPEPLQVDFYLRLLEDGRDEKKRSQASRNRRLAAMNRSGASLAMNTFGMLSALGGRRGRLLPSWEAGAPQQRPALAVLPCRLLKEGTYFSEKEMRDRQPGTYHQVGWASAALQPCASGMPATPAAASI